MLRTVINWQISTIIIVKINFMGIVAPNNGIATNNASRLIKIGNKIIPETAIIASSIM